MRSVKNQPSNSTSCSDNVLRLLVLMIAGKVYSWLQVMSSFCNLGLHFEGLFRERYILEGQIAFEGHWRLQFLTLVVTSQPNPQASFVVRGWMDGFIDGWAEREKGMKRKLTDDGRGRYCPCSGTGDTRARGRPEGSLRAPPTRGNFVFFLWGDWRRGKGREGKGRKGKGKLRGACREREEIRHLRLALAFPSRLSCRCCASFSCFYAACSLGSVAVRCCFFLFFLSFCPSVRPSIVVKPSPSLPSLAFPATSRSEATIDKCRRRWCLVFDLRGRLRHRSAQGERERGGEGRRETR